MESQKIKNGKYTYIGGKFEKINKTPIPTLIKLYAFEILLVIILIINFYFYISFFLNLIHPINDILFIFADSLLIFLFTSQISYDRRYPEKKRFNGYFLLAILIFLNIAFIIFFLKILFRLSFDIIDYYTFVIFFFLGIMFLIIVLLRSILLKLRKRTKFKTEHLKVDIKTNSIKLLISNSILAIILISFISLIAITSIIIFNDTIAKIQVSGQVVVEQRSIWDAWDWVSFIRNMALMGAFIGFFLFVEWRWDVFFDFDDDWWGYETTYEID